jgi:hypothetical protein
VSVEGSPDLTSDQRAKLLRNTKTIVWASNRRVDITLSAAGQTQTSARRYPFNAADSLSLLGGGEGSSKAGRTTSRKAPAKKAAHKAKKARHNR